MLPSLYTRIFTKLIITYFAGDEFIKKKKKKRQRSRPDRRRLQ